MNKRLSFFMSLLVIILAPVTAMAAPVIFTHSGMGSGSLGGVSFDSSSFTITAYGDTDNVNSSSIFADFFTDHDSAFINIDGTGTYEFLIPTQTFVYGDRVAGFGWYNNISDEIGMDLFTGPTDYVGYDGWEMQTSIGPLTGIGIISQWTFADVNTSGGILILDNSSTGGATFSATVVPVPTTILLLFSGLAGLVGIRRKYKK